MQNLEIKNKEPSDSTPVSYYKLPYIRKFVDRNQIYYCKNTNIKIVFSPFTVGDLFSIKQSVPNYPRSFVGLHVLGVTPVILVKQLAT